MIYESLAYLASVDFVLFLDTQTYLLICSC